MAVFDIAARDGGRDGHQRVFDALLHFVDVDFGARIQRGLQRAGDALGEVGVGVAGGGAGGEDGVGDARALEGGAAAVALDDHGGHEILTTGVNHYIWLTLWCLVKMLRH